MKNYLSGDWAKEAVTEIYNDLINRIEKGEDILYTIRNNADNKGGFVEVSIISRMKPIKDSIQQPEQ